MANNSVDSGPDGFDLPSGKRILSSQDVYHLALNRYKTSRLMDMVHRKFGNEVFKVMCKVPFGEIDEFIYKLAPEFTFTSDSHIMNEVERCIQHLSNYPDHPDIKAHAGFMETIIPLPFRSRRQQ